MQAIWDKVWKAVHRQRLHLTEKKRKAAIRIWIPAPPRELRDVQGGICPSARKFLQWLVLKLMGGVSLELVSPEGVWSDMPKYLLSESTVFTYLPIFKIFVKSYEKPQMIKFGPIQYPTYSVILSHYKWYF